MRVLVLGMASKATDEQALPIKMGTDPAAFEAMGKFIQELTDAGILVMSEGLKPSRFGKRVRFDGPKPLVTDGPFTETKELVASYSVWEVKSMDEALEWVKRFPDPFKSTSEIIIRPILGLEDFDFGGAVPQSEKEGWEKMSGRAQ